MTMPHRPNHRFEEIAALLREKQRFVVISHMRPDADAYGSQLAMTLLLRALGKDVKAWNEDGMVDSLNFLPGAELLSAPPAEPEDFDVAVVLDTGTLKRAGTPLQSVRHADAWVNIDHHVSNERYGDLIYIDSNAPATGEILFEFIHASGFSLTPDIAENLFAAISTDTGSFQYPSTTARTYEIAAELIRAGVDVGELSRRLYDSYPKRRILLMKEMLNELQFDFDDRVVSFALSLETVNRLGSLPEDTEGLINTIRAVDSAVMAAFFEELSGGKIRVSLRSKHASIDVCEICKIFGGGGHALAAGARIVGSLEEVRKNVLEVAGERINKLS